MKKKMHIIIKKMKSPLKEERSETGLLRRCCENVGLGLHWKEEAFLKEQVDGPFGLISGGKQQAHFTPTGTDWAFPAHLM